MVPRLPLSALVSVPTPQKGPCCKRSQSSLNNWNPSARCLMAVCFLALFMSSSSSGIDSEALISIKLTSSRYVSWNSSLSPPPFCHIHNLFHGFFDWICHKSCGVMHNIWTQFSSAGIYCFQVRWLSQFLSNNSILSGVILLDFHDALSEFSSIVLTVFSIKYHVQWAS